MAKHKHSEEVEPEAVPEVVAPVAPVKTWLVGEKGGDKQEVVHADTLEDAIRTFNGQRTNFTRKQLDILEG